MTFVGWTIIAGVILILVILFLVALSKQYRKVGPNEVLIISGGRRRTVVDPDGTKRKIGYRMHIGGGTFVIPFLEKAEVFPLEVFTINIEIPDGLTAKGIELKAVGQAQVKVKGDDYSIRLAVEQFLGKGLEGMKEITRQILEGDMRGVLGSLTVEEIYQKRDDFAEKVAASSMKAFESMGLTILSFALKEISDSQGYIEALGKPHIARVKGEAEIAQAEADMEATIKAAQARKEGDVAKFQAESEIAKASRDYEIQRAGFQTDINQKRAVSDSSYDLERLKMNQQIKKEEYKVRLIEKEEAIKVEEKEVLRKEMELESTIKKAADAMKYQAQAETEAETFKLEARAKGKAEAIKQEGMAEAEAMAKKAESWSKYNQAAIYQMYIDVLPELAKAVSEPLSKVDKIIMVGNSADGASKVTGQVAQVLAQLPSVVEALSGIDIKEFLKALPKKQTSKNKTE
ncbi:MAG: flotillin [candidate division Zixibacteria bacterium 4484_95]|nr:MAG: flotillin [candidate division Zixibacteria bacterium 4484_95]